MLRIVLLIALVACGENKEPPKTTSHTTAMGSAPGSAAPTVAPGSGAAPLANDPWANTAKTANGSGSESVADIACPTVSAPFFYRVEKDGTTNYLLGTRHIGVALRKMPEPVHAALRDASLVVLETAGPDHSKDKPQPTAREALGEKLWARYRELAGDSLANAMENSTALQATLMLMIRYEDKLSSLEREITEVAEAAKTPMQGLETHEFQQALLEKWLDARAARSYVEHIDSLDELRADTIEDLQGYCEGTDDVPGIDNEQHADMIASGYTEAEIKQFDKDMLEDRNARWIPKLEKLYAQNKVFVAVGGDHLSGPNGVITLLAKKGYAITRVVPPTKTPESQQ